MKKDIVAAVSLHLKNMDQVGANRSKWLDDEALTETNRIVSKLVTL
jgi:hypothetical protein